MQQIKVFQIIGRYEDAINDWIKSFYKDHLQVVIDKITVVDREQHICIVYRLYNTKCGAYEPYV